ncbi:uncharacterized protein LOC143154525 [Ptiloglossa arizonensis]|uniref:uncharacterized protein LOC143154524 n=1 Tax=Ptiloglossa arizonensis TaxID=3350558 RepID=UPI003FA16BD3
MAPSVESRLRVLNSQRAAFKDEVAAFSQFLDGCDPTVQEDEIEMRVADLTNEFASFGKSQTDLDSTDETGDSRRERIHIKNSYFSCLAVARRLLKSVQTVIAQQPQRERFANTTPTSAEVLEGDINLPKLNLPQFSGRYEEWPGFADQFRSAVHDSVRLSDCRKLMYLRSCLRGEASSLIESLEISAANYVTAWNLVEEHYNRPAVIVNNHVRALFELPSMAKVTHSNLRPFLTTLESHYRALKTIQQPSADTLLIFLCLSRLDQETNLKWREHTRENTFPSLDELCKFLRDRCHDLEPSNTASAAHRADVHNRAPHIIPTPRPARPMQLRAHETRVHTTVQISCPMCRAPHSIYACDEFKKATVAQRAKVVAEARLCLNCLKQGHVATACTVRNCQVCNEKHHTLLHTDAPEDLRPSGSRVHVTCLSSNTDSRAILSTAIINVVNKNGESRPCRIMVDSCAQSHFLTHRFAKRLNLQLNETQIPVTGMNRMKSEITHYAKARIQSRVTSFASEVTFLIAEEIAAPLPDVQIDRDKLQLPNNIPLADPEFHKPSEIDGLLGAQLFWNLLSVGQIRLAEPTVMLRKTLLGWLVVGENASQNRTVRGSSANQTLQRQNKVNQIAAGAKDIRKRRNDRPTMDEDSAARVEGFRREPGKRRKVSARSTMTPRANPKQPSRLPITGGRTSQVQPR